MADKKEELYVGVHDKVDLRRSILESSKGAIYLLQKHEQFKELRKRREEETEKLKKTHKELQQLVTKLKQVLPKHKFPKAKKTEKSPEKPEKEAPAKISHPKGELHKLDSALDEIESRLNRI